MPVHFLSGSWAVWKRLKGYFTQNWILFLHFLDLLQTFINILDCLELMGHHWLPYHFVFSTMEVKNILVTNIAQYLPSCLSRTKTFIQWRVNDQIFVFGWTIPKFSLLLSLCGSSMNRIYCTELQILFTWLLFNFAHFMFNRYIN